MKKEIWIWVEHRKGEIDDNVFPLLHEARRLRDDVQSQPRVAALVLGSELNNIVSSLKIQGFDRIIVCEDDSLDVYHGELYARLLGHIARENTPECLLMADSPMVADLAPRLAALMESALVRRVIDITLEQNNDKLFTRPIANGYLSEELRIKNGVPFIATFVPAILNEWSSKESSNASPKVQYIELEEFSLQTRWIEFQEADPGDMDLEDAEIIVAGGRGVGKDNFDSIFQLAESLGASVGVTRPVVDWNLVPFDRQIGQTGKTVTPELIINCGISGANEYTTGMEKAKQTIAINVDPRARIFDFADLGAVGDVHEIIPILIDRIRKLKDNEG